jgi:hypothetical protein
MAYRRNNMFTRKVLVSALFAAGAIGAVATPLSSVAQVVLYLNTAPPAVRYEAVPTPRSGYVWVPGHRRWDGYGRVWVPGHWERQHGYAPRRWDLDGDGVPNRYDARPNNPYRY